MVIHVMASAVRLAGRLKREAETLEARRTVAGHKGCPGTIGRQIGDHMGPQFIQFVGSCPRGTPLLGHTQIWTCGRSQICIQEADMARMDEAGRDGLQAALDVCSSCFSPPVSRGLLDLCQLSRLLLLLLLLLLLPHRTSTASARSQCSPPDPNSKLRISVIPAGPHPPAPDQSVPRRTSTTKNLRRYAR